MQFCTATNPSQKAVRAPLALIGSRSRDKHGSVVVNSEIILKKNGEI